MNMRIGKLIRYSKQTVYPLLSPFRSKAVRQETEIQSTGSRIIVPVTSELKSAAALLACAEANMNGEWA